MTACTRNRCPSLLHNVLMRLLAATIFASFLAFPAVGQTRGAYFELLGNGGLFSFNYEQEVRPRLLLRTGVGAWESEDLFSSNKVSIVSVPLTATYLIGSGRHFFETGGGVLLGHQDNPGLEQSGPFASLTAVIGYRYQKERGFLFRAGLTPFVPITSGDNAYPDENAMASVGVSFGRTW